jgi:hypothetical protein
MNQLPANHVAVNVTITENPDGGYIWDFESEYEGFDPQTGKVTLQETGPTKITYYLLGHGYNLIYANLDPMVCATREIHNVAIDVLSNSITITDANSNGETGTQPISIRLIARVGGDTGAPIISPDPEVQNDPSDHVP